MTTYRLLSGPMVYAPGIVEWAMAHYSFEEDQPRLRAVITGGWKLPDEIAHKLLTREVPFTVEDEAVIFTIE